MADVIKLDDYREELRIRMYVQWLQDPENHELIGFPPTVAPQVTLSEEGLQFLEAFLQEDDLIIFPD